MIKIGNLVQGIVSIVTPLNSPYILTRFYKEINVTRFYIFLREETVGKRRLRSGSYQEVLLHRELRPFCVSCNSFK